MNKSQQLIGIFFLALMVGVIGSEAAQANDEHTWYYQSWRQWHPQIGHRALGNAGTQFYFPQEDYVAGDSDGVLDKNDDCPGSPSGVKVGKRGCPPYVAKIANLDLDGDRVPNESDACSNTPTGAVVDARGCWHIENILFDFDKSQIKGSFMEGLNGVSSVLRNNPNVTMKLYGHTDSTGPKAYNQKLSERRNDSVRAYLLNRGVASAQIWTQAFGETQPAADNSSREGRALNRRTELLPSVR